jgi:hypothetical protein
LQPDACACAAIPCHLRSVAERREADAAMRGQHGAHPIDCTCVHCVRRRQLLSWRDHMVYAQQQSESARDLLY